jgi:HEAT repeat protein
MSILEVLALSEDLKSNDAETRAKAALALGKAGKEARAAMPAMLEALRDTDEHVRNLVADALDQAGPPAKEDFPAISTALRDDDPDVRTYAVSVLEDMGEDAWEEIDRVRQMTKDEDPHVSAAAKKTLARLEKDMLEVLQNRLKDADPETRRDAADRLSDLGAASPEAAERASASLLAAMSDDNEAVRVAVSRALTEFGAQVVPLLVEALRNNNKVVRRMAIASLGSMGADAIEAVPTLAGMVDDADVGEVAAAALAENFGDLAVPAIAAALGSSTIIDNRRVALQNLLVRIGPSGLPALNYYVSRYPAARVRFNTVFNQLNVLPPATFVRVAPVDPFAARAYNTYYNDFIARSRAWYNPKGEYLNLEKARLGLGVNHAAFKRLLVRMDRNGDGQISRSEYERWTHDRASQLAREDLARKNLVAAQINLHKQVTQSTKAAQQAAAQVVRHSLADSATKSAAAESQLRSMNKKALPQQLDAHKQLINSQRALARLQRHAPATNRAPAPTKRVQPVRPPVNTAVAQRKPPTRSPMVHRPATQRAAPPPPRGGRSR